MKILLSIEETANALGIGRTKVYDLINSNILPKTKIGSRTLISIYSIEKFVEYHCGEV